MPAKQDKQKMISAVKEVKHLLDLWLPLRMKYDKVPGISIAIVYQGDILYQDGFGYADMEAKIKAGKNTLYHIASISKTFTATAIMQLVEKGRIRLDDPVSQYLKWFKGQNQKGKLEDITIRHLLSHTSGLWRDGDTPHWLTGQFPRELKSNVKDNLILEPLSDFKYSNYGFSVLGEVIKVITGMSYGEYVTKNILKPLKMLGTSPDYHDNLENVASGYGREIPGEPQEKFAHFAAKAYAPATGFVSNAPDLAKFLTAMSLSADNKILSRKSKREMSQPHRDVDDGDRYCLGLEIFNLDGRKIYGHGGGFHGFSTMATLDPLLDLGVVVLSNSIKTPVGSYLRSIFQAIYSLTESEKDYLSEEKIDQKSYEGIYRNVWGDDVIIKLKDKLVTFSIFSRSPLFGDNKSILSSTKIKHQFLMKKDGDFGSKGELVKFSDFRNGQAQTVTFGAHPSRRVNKLP